MFHYVSFWKIYFDELSKNNFEMPPMPPMPPMKGFSDQDFAYGFDGTQLYKEHPELFKTQKEWKKLNKKQQKKFQELQKKHAEAIEKNAVVYRKQAENAAKQAEIFRRNAEATRLVAVERAKAAALAAKARDTFPRSTRNNVYIYKSDKPSLNKIDFGEDGDIKVFVDGKETTMEEMKKIEPSKIESIHVNKQNKDGVSNGEIRLILKK